MARGKFIVIEGIDGSGKGTQADKLTLHLNSEGKEVVALSFPRYDQPSSYFVTKYLNGKYGTSTEEVNPYQASLFYALDRFDAKVEIERLLNSEINIICNRYVASNMGHQGARIKDKEERKKYFTWIQNLEYATLGVPKPDINILLHVTAALAQTMVDKKQGQGRLYLSQGKRDLHEADLGHLQNAESAYKEMAELFPDQFVTVECMKGDEILTVHEIQAKIVEKVRNILK